MIYGSHLVVFSSDGDADRAFLQDVLGFEHVDAGGGWLIFGLPPAELAVHPADAPGAELYFICDDLTAEMQRLEQKGVTVPQSRKPGGDRSRRSDSPAAARSVSTNRSIRRWCTRADEPTGTAT